jgi:hypothetical protein
LPGSVSAVLLLSVLLTNFTTIAASRRKEPHLSACISCVLISACNFRHPDKFVQMFDRYLAPKDRSLILEAVQTVIQLLNSLADASEEGSGKTEFHDSFKQTD